MTAKNLAEIRNSVKQHLHDEFEVSAGEDFSADELNVIVGSVLVEVSKASPYKVVEVLLTIANSKQLDISAIENLIGIEKVEYPVSNSDENYRNFKYKDNETILLDMSSSFSNTGTGSTLTGTVTFASGSATVTGSGTAFTTELDAGYFIKKSAGTRWYRIYSVESATSLTLEESVKSDDTGADTVDVTQYRDYVARVYCRKLHNLTETASSLNVAEEECLIYGATARAASNWINQFRTMINNSIEAIAKASESIDDMTPRIKKALQDLNDARDNIAKLTWANAADKYLSTVAGGLRIAEMNLGQSQGTFREIQTNLNIGRVIEEYMRFANTEYAKYQQALTKIRKPRVQEQFSRD